MIEKSRPCGCKGNCDPPAASRLEASIDRRSFLQRAALLAGSVGGSTATVSGNAGATPLSRDALEMTQSASVLSDENLNRAQGNSLGDTLKNMPGVTTCSGSIPPGANNRRT